MGQVDADQTTMDVDMGVWTRSLDDQRTPRRRSALCERVARDGILSVHRGALERVHLETLVRDPTARDSALLEGACPRRTANAARTRKARNDKARPQGEAALVFIELDLAEMQARSIR